MLKRFLEELKLLFWICGKNYTQTLHQVFDHPQTRMEWLNTISLVAKKYFPFFNTGYFENYQGLKKETEQNVGITVKEIPMPDSVLGAYIPQEEKGTILINSLIHPVFKLSTLAHELSHVGVCKYYHQQGSKLETLQVKNRVPLFKEALEDKEEVLADALIAIGTYPLKDFENTFSQKPLFGIRSFFQAVKHLRKHYPDVTRGFLFSRAIFLNIALIAHFLRLRIFLYKELSI